MDAPFEINGAAVARLAIMLRWSTRHVLIRKECFARIWVILDRKLRYICTRDRKIVLIACERVPVASNVVAVQSLKPMRVSGCIATYSRQLCSSNIHILLFTLVRNTGIVVRCVSSHWSEALVIACCHRIHLAAVCRSSDEVLVLGTDLKPLGRDWE